MAVLDVSRIKTTCPEKGRKDRAQVSYVKASHQKLSHVWPQKEDQDDDEGDSDSDGDSDDDNDGGCDDYGNDDSNDSDNGSDGGDADHGDGVNLKRLVAISVNIEARIH